MRYINACIIIIIIIIIITCTVVLWVHAQERGVLTQIFLDAPLKVCTNLQKQREKYF